MVSEWSAKCSTLNDPMSCTGNIDAPGDPMGGGAGKINGDAQAARNFAWTSLTYMLFKHHVSWRYYVAEGQQPDCEDNAATCAPGQQRVGTPDIWNPLPGFTDVRQDGQLSNVQTIDHFYADVKSGNLPEVRWIVPNGAVSEHPPGSRLGGPDVRHDDDRRHHVQRSLEHDRSLSQLGRLGRLL